MALVTHAPHLLCRCRRCRQGVRPSRALRLRHGGRLPLPCLSAHGGMRLPNYHPHRLSRLRLAREHQTSPDCCLLD